MTCSRRWRKARVPAGDLALISLPAAAAGDALRRDGLPGGNIRSDGLPLLQPLPLRWSGRPRGLRIVNNVDIAKTYILSHPIGWSRLPGKLGFNITVTAIITIVGQLSDGLHTGPL